LAAASKPANRWLSSVSRAISSVWAKPGGFLMPQPGVVFVPHPNGYQHARKDNSANYSA